MGFISFDNQSDTASVVTTTVVGKTFRLREIILGSLAIVAFIIVIILAVLLAVKSSDSDCDAVSCSSANTGTHQAQDYCDSMECLKSAVYQKPIMDETADPCQDFYTFACGNYATLHEQTPDMPEVTAVQEIGNLNRQRMETVMNHPVVPDTPHHEKIVKTFMNSCTRHFDKMSLRGSPMIQKVIQPMGGWWLFNTDDLNQFDFQNSFDMAMTQFLAGPFMNFGIAANENSMFTTIVELHQGEDFLPPVMYTDNNFAKEQANYKLYMQNIASLLLRDNGTPLDQDKLKTFSDDVFEVEHAMAQLSTQDSEGAHDLSALWTLAEVNDNLKRLNLTKTLQGVFDHYPETFNNGAKIAVVHPSYFRKLGTTLDSILRSMNGTRKIHNYLIWSVIINFSMDLSWDYIYATQEFLYITTGEKIVYSIMDECYHRAVFLMLDAVNALFIKHFVKEQGMYEAKIMVDNIKSVLLDAINNLTWMTSTDRIYATKKVHNLLYRIGYAAGTTDAAFLDNIYRQTSMDSTDYFGNVLSLLRLHKDRLNRLLGKTNFRDEWNYQVAMPGMRMDFLFQRFVATAAIFQNPLFSHNGPKYYNYGGVGAIAGAVLVHTIDYIGSHYRTNGQHFGSWWSASTTDHYNKLDQCAVDAWKAASLGDFKDQDGNTLHARHPISYYASAMSSYLLAVSSGLRLSYKAYHEKMANTGQENLPPGFSKYTSDQMFFISFAQGYCQNSPDSLKIARLEEYGLLPRKTRVPVIMKQVPEFKAAFKCPAKSSDPGPCLLFNL